MLLPLLPVIALLGGQAQAPPPPTTVTQPAQTVQRPAPPPIYPTTDDVKTRLERALYLADFDDVRVLINFGSNDDARSQKFAQALRDPVVMKTKYSADEYHVVNIDIGKLDKNLDLAKQYGVTLKAELLPMLTVLDEHGKILAQASGPDFASAADPAAFDTAKIAAFFTKHQAPFPDAMAPFEAGIKRAKAEGKTVFVWWSAPW
jgi:hypothetical protein